ncbi:MAG TPA: MmcQ/YjbR family DNA-binding protein [Nocardioidaceae bacterium]|nr:MmcQ/YjbR family DNA-binding protein [Nocardioidaceae bacterium]
MGEHSARPIGVTLDDVRSLALPLPRTEEALVRDHVKFRVRGIVYASVSPDDSLFGFAYPRDERAALVAAQPDKFQMPLKSDEQYQWMRARMAALDVAELRELLLDAWQMVVPQKVVREHFSSIGLSRPAAREIRST